MPPKGWKGAYHKVRRSDIPRAPRVSPYLTLRGMVTYQVNDQIVIIGFPNAYEGPKLAFLSFAHGPLFCQAMTPDEMQEAVRLARHMAEERERVREQQVPAVSGNREE